MYRLGFTDDDLTFKPQEYFMVEGHPEASIRMRYERHLNRVANNVLEVKRRRRLFII